ncbi:hypothetical protein B0H14DRAFT_2903798 [Mycena olivaceomarginata]|nr:hypothetical protein B0H14DRAFT_2903798 [Mycena olivaceomarginata]
MSVPKPILPAVLADKVNIPDQSENPPSLKDVGLALRLRAEAKVAVDHGSISQDEYGSIVAYKHKVLISYTSEDLTELIRKLDQSLEGQRTITEKIDDLQKDIDELKPQLSKLMTVSMRGPSFEVVPFDNGTSPPANLPVLGSVDIIRDLNPIQSSEYYKGYGGAPQRGGNAQQNHLTRKEFIRRRVGCSVELQ